MAIDLNNLAACDLEEITKLAGLAFTPREVAIMMQADIDKFICFCENDSHPFYIAFFSGRLQAEVEVRTSIIKLAKSGSSPAQTMAVDLFNKSKIKMIDR